MSDYEQIPGSIRSLLATKSQNWSDHTADLAAQYALLCDDTNQRLRRCAEYLRRGMRSAAIHLAECQPNLVQAVGALRFPERAAWADLCVNHGMQAPAVLEAECLDQLKAAYEREKSLQPLLSRHRLLAIAKAPAAARLEVARMLGQEDTENPSWPDEIRALESVRLGEIEVKAQAALLNRDDAVVESLWNELNSQSWLCDIPKALYDGLEKRAAELKDQRTLDELPALAAKVVAAFSTEPPGEDLGNLVKEWTETVATLGLAIPSDLAAQIQPALDWDVAEQRRKLELEAVKPLQHLFDSSDRKSAVPKGGSYLRVVTIVVMLAIAAAALYYYLHYIHKE